MQTTKKPQFMKQEMYHTLIALEECNLKDIYFEVLTEMIVESVVRRV
jgi:hypothetical protein